MKAVLGGVAGLAAWLGMAASAWGQSVQHTQSASGMSHGLPRVCVPAGTSSVGSGAWSSPSTWSTGRVPAAGDAVLVSAETIVTYDQVSDAPLECVDIEGQLRFRTGASTRLTVGTLTVIEQGRLEIGTVESPVAAGATAEVVIADRPIDVTRDPEQWTAGLVGLGTVRIHGTPKTATFVRVAAEPLMGQSTLSFSETVTTWHVGDRLVLPDTRQLRDHERRTRYTPGWEELTVQALAGSTVTLTAPLAFDHKGARRPDGGLEFLPHVGNLTRNVVIRSANPAGTRGHVIFTAHSDVDIRYALFKDLGRTRAGVLDNTEMSSDGTVRHVGTNQIGRYSLHFHHAFGPQAPQANGHQFTIIGNAVDGASKWGITVHNSHYGLIQDNVVYDSQGAGIVTEDGTESFNLFEHNFSVRSKGSGEFAPSSGYGGAAPDPGGEGAGFWMRGPNNIVRNNVAANTEVFGFGLAAGGLGTVRIPAFKGADTSHDGQWVTLDTTEAPLLEFTGNEAYGAIETGAAVGWNGTLTNTHVWHAWRHAIAAFPTDRLTVEGAVVRDDASVLSDPIENATGIWFTNYASKSVMVRNADVQGTRVGVASPFFVRADAEAGRGDGRAIIEDSYFRSYVGVAVATAYTNEQKPLKQAVVRNTRFEGIDVPGPRMYEPAAISMNYGMSRGDLLRRDPLVVYDFNREAGNTFRVFYSLDVPASMAPCRDTRADVAGFVCAGAGKSAENAGRVPHP
jgi:G8 domain/Right handed beta helix region